MSLPKCEEILNTFKNKNIAKYGGGTPIDPNTTIEDLILTQKNTPGNQYFYIITFFYNLKTQYTNRAQIAIGYNLNEMHQRFFFENHWSEWRKI